MNKIYIYIGLILGITYSCGGGGDDTTIEKENLAPSVPVKLYPLNNTLCVENPIRFQWETSIDPENNPVSYKLEISEKSDFSTLVESKNTTLAAQTLSLNKGKVFYWRVKAVDTNNKESEFSSSGQFLTEGEGVSNHIPFAPELISPKSYSVIDGTSVTLNWSATDADQDALTYDLYLDTASSPVTKVLADKTVTTYNATNLTAATTYYFKVVVKDNKGGSTIGQVWTFSTK